MSKRAVQSVITAIQKRYPTRLADKSWDNTGLLVESYPIGQELDKLNVLLTVDLTQSVAEEAIKQKANLIIAYHPFIFKGLKSITTEDPQQRSLIKLIQNSISVYSPHTAVDSAKEGVNDFLADGIGKGFKEKERSPIEANMEEGGAGMGRIVTLSEPASLGDLVTNAKKSLGLKYVQVATNQSPNQQISKIAICAGSGGSVFSGVDADLYYTGEISHHQALYISESGSSLIVCNHSNTERAFLSVLKLQLEAELLGNDVNISISESDRDPLELW